MDLIHSGFLNNKYKPPTYSLIISYLQLHFYFDSIIVTGMILVSVIHRKGIKLMTLLEKINFIENVILKIYYWHVKKNPIKLILFFS